MEPSKSSIFDFKFSLIVDLLIRLAVLYLLISWCFGLLRPFFEILIWGCIISIAVYPAYHKLALLLKGKKIIASLIVTLLMLSVLIVPSWLVTESLINGIDFIRHSYREGQPLIPPPGPSTKDWPVFLKPVVDVWQLASANLEGLLMKYRDQLKEAGSMLLSLFAGFGKGIAMFLASIILSGVLLNYSDDLAEAASKIFQKLSGDRDENFAAITVNTVRSVVKGILGVAVIQSALAGIGFFAAGIPFAGLWTVLCLVLAIVQVGSGPVVIPIVIYTFSTADTLTAVLLAIWMAIVLVSDNVLKPLLLGRGASVPMLVVFLGAIGGFITTGFLGLFIGAVVLSIGYKLFIEWKNEPN